jgi:hypothetical protein
MSLKSEEECSCVALVRKSQRKFWSNEVSICTVYEISYFSNTHDTLIQFLSLTSRQIIVTNRYKIFFWLIDWRLHSRSARTHRNTPNSQSIFENIYQCFFKSYRETYLHILEFLVLDLAVLTLTSAGVYLWFVISQRSNDCKVWEPLIQFL